MQNHTPVQTEGNPTKNVEIALGGYVALIAGAQELAEAWDTMEEEEQVLQRTFVMSEWGKRHVLGEFYRRNELSPAQVNELARLDHALLDQAANIEIAYGPTIWQLVKNLLDWGTPLSKEQGSVRLTVPVQTLPALAELFAK